MIGIMPMKEKTPESEKYNPFEGRHAKLFIPFTEDHSKAFQWRLWLIKQNQIYPIETLINHLQQAKSHFLDESTRKDVVRFAKSDSVVLDELELTTLIVTGWLLEAETIPENKLLFIDRRSRNLLKYASIKDPREYLTYTRKNLKRQGEELLTYEVAKYAVA